jgi:hypothetical protein
VLDQHSLADADAHLAGEDEEQARRFGWYPAVSRARIEIYVEPDNLASRTAARRAGFTEEGVLRERGQFGNERRDLVLYSRLRSDD